jgi:hypothetical protein
VTLKIRLYVNMLFLVAACVVLAVPVNGQAVQQTLVVNGTGHPVPTAAQGTTEVTGTVNIGNTPSVTVRNPIDGQNNPMPIAVLEAIQPYEDSCQIIFADNNLANCFFKRIPDKKLLVVQEFDARGLTGLNVQPIFVSVFTTSNMFHYFPATAMGAEAFATHQETRLYVRSSQNFGCFVGLSVSSRGSDYDCQISGFLVDTP